MNKFICTCKDNCSNSCSPIHHPGPAEGDTSIDLHSLSKTLEEIYTAVLRINGRLQQVLDMAEDMPEELSDSDTECD